jgi:Ca2+-binding EF-hand superfamily protein
MDKDKTGFITPDELKEALNLEHFDFNEEQIDSIMKQVDI